MSLKWKPSLSSLWILAPVCLSLIIYCFMPLKEGDLWWNLLAGERIVMTRSLPTADFMTFTAAGQPYAFEHYWLSELVLYLFFKINGLPALVLCQALVGTSLIWIIFVEARQRGASSRVAGGMSLVALAGLSTFSSTRPQIFSFIGFGVLFVILSNFQRGKTRYLWFIPLVMAAWVNLHPGWAIGVFLLGVWVGLELLAVILRQKTLRSLTPLLVWGAAGLAALLINPHGARVLGAPFILGSNAIVQQFISEWQPASPAQVFTWPLFYLNGLLLIALAFSRRRVTYPDFFLLLVFMAFSFRYVRMLPFLIILATPIVAGMVGGLNLQRIFGIEDKTTQETTLPKNGNVTINRVIALILLVAVLISLPQIRLALTGQPETTLVSPYFPQNAANNLADLSEDDLRLFSMPEWGGYLAWRLASRASVFVDGRVELFPFEVWRDYMQIANAAPGWLELLHKYQVDYLVLDQTGQGELVRVAQEAGLKCTFADSGQVLCGFSR